MQLLPRMRYLIRICSTSKAAVNNCLLVLIRIIQHDSQCAHRVFQCPGLISVVMNLFFTEDSTEVQIYTLKFLKCLCLSGKQTCQDLVSVIVSIPQSCYSSQSISTWLNVPYLTVPTIERYPKVLYFTRIFMWSSITWALDRKQTQNLMLIRRVSDLGRFEKVWFECFMHT